MSRNIFINKNFFLMWAGKAISQTGDKFYSIALAWWILQKTNSTEVMGFFMAASVLPGLILGPFVGALVDKYNRKILLVASDLVRGLVVAMPAYLSYSGALELWQLFTAAVILSAASAFFDPAAQAVTPQIVSKEQLPHANALNQMVGAFSMIIGPALGAAFVSFFGFTLVFSFNAVSYFISALFEALMYIAPVSGSQSISNKLWEEVKAGIGFLLRNQRVLVIIVIIGIAHFFVGSLMVALPFLAKQLRGSSIQHLGNMEMLLGLGMFTGSVYVHAKANADMKDSRLFLFMLAFGLCYICIGITNMLTVSFILPYLLLMFTIGLTIANASIFWQTLLQTNTPQHLSGRVFSISSLAGNASMPLSYCVFGVLLGYIPLKAAMIISGICLMLISAILMRGYAPLRDTQQQSIM